MENSIIIVGRGPVGMTTALTLASYGIPSVVIDTMPRNVVSPGSKAVLIAGHVMDVTEPFGVGEQIVEEGLAWQKNRTFIRGKEVAVADVGAKQGHLPELVNLTQQRVEELLIDRLLAEPLISLMADSEVTKVEDKGDQVEVTVSSHGREQLLTTPWLVGCDGSRSIVRKQLGIPFEGYGHDENFLIVDIAAKLPFPNERHFHFDPPFNPGRTVLIHPQPGSTWHIDWQVGPEVNAEEEKSSGRLEKRIRSIIGDADYELHWSTTYKFKQLKAKRFREGRCFLVGDAAHLTSPYGARGMNSGIADAENLAWRLALVVKHLADESLLDGYAIEREYASSENLRITGKTARFMCPPTLAGKLRQRAILAVARQIPTARRWIDSGQLYAPTTYPATINGTKSPEGSDLLGSVAPDGLVYTADLKATRLRKQLRRGITILAIPGQDHSKVAAVAEDLQAILPVELPLQILELVRCTPTHQINSRHIQIHDLNGLMHSTWVPDEGVPAEGIAYIIRPDSYVAAQVPLHSQNITEELNTNFSIASKMNTKGIHHV